MNERNERMKNEIKGYITNTNGKGCMLINWRRKSMI